MARRASSKRTSSQRSTTKARSSPLSFTRSKLSDLWSKLLDYQRDAVKSALRIRQCAIYFDPRTGKTYVTGGIINELMSPDFQGLLIVPLASKERTWVRFLNTYCANALLCETWEEYQFAGERPRILLLHYEMVPKLIKKLRKVKWTMITYDEAHRLKGRNTKYSRRAKQLRHCAEYKFLLTGTPIEKSQQDLWPQFRFMKPEVFGDRWSDFDEQFLKPSGYMGYKREFREEKLQEFLDLVEPHCIRITQKMVGFPDLELIEEPVQLRGKQRLIYEELEKESLVRVRGQKISAPFPMTRVTKMQQACGGFVLDDEGNAHHVGDAKLRRLKLIIKRSPKPFVVFCRYIAEINGIANALAREYSVAILTGETRRLGLADSLLDDFQKKKYDVLVMQTTVGKESIDLSIAKHGAVYSLTYSSIDFDQLKNRMQNLNSKVGPKLFLIYAEDTVDEPIYSAIVHKRKVKDSILTYLRKR